jgi:hypothetical protein
VLPDSLWTVAAYGGQILFIMLLLIGIGKCIDSAEERGASSHCAFALLFALTALLIGACLVLARPLLLEGTGLLIAAIAGAIMALFMVLALVWSIWGLVEVITNPRHFKFGAKLGALGLLLVLVESGVLSAGGVYIYREGIPDFLRPEPALVHATPLVPDEGLAAGKDSTDDSSGPVLTVSKHPKPPESSRPNKLASRTASRSNSPVAVQPPVDDAKDFISFPELRFRFRNLPAPWKRTEIVDSTDGPVLEFRREHPSFSFTLIAKRTTDGLTLDTRQLANQVRAEIRDRTPYSSIDDRPVIIADLPGIRVDASERSDKLQTADSYWVVVYGGFAYRLCMSGAFEDHATIRSQASDLFRCFEPLNKTSPAVASPAPTRGKSETQPAARRSQEG